MDAFQAAKTAVWDVTCLSHPCPQAAISLSVNTFEIHEGGGRVLQQWEAGAWRPFSFISCKLDQAWSRYSYFFFFSRAGSPSSGQPLTFAYTECQSQGLTCIRDTCQT
jgi:hypothetical protein